MSSISNLETCGKRCVHEESYGTGASKTIFPRNENKSNKMQIN